MNLPNLPEFRLELIRKVTELNEEDALALVQARLAEGGDPLTIVEDCQEGLRQVGVRYERREYYLAGLIMAGEIFREVMELLAPIIEIKFTGNETGTILLGTVEGDIHDIGKNNLSLLLTSYGFTVYDLGVDVPAQEFLNKAKEFKPDIVGLSGLITSSFDSMRETVRLLRTSDDPEIAAIPIILGGNQLNEQVCEYIGADAWVTDAMTGVRLCQRMLAEMK
ncbi:MAG: cobalamin B12-binding domain-containing protein [Anaerolineales bacterium]|nr:cobalamin B12-binding domain-containing protein [Anaerolineales bacterium]